MLLFGGVCVCFLGDFVGVVLWWVWDFWCWLLIFGLCFWGGGLLCVGLLCVGGLVVIGLGFLFWVGVIRFIVWDLLLVVSLVWWCLGLSF